MALGPFVEVTGYCIFQFSVPIRCLLSLFLFGDLRLHLLQSSSLLKEFRDGRLSMAGKTALTPVSTVGGFSDHCFLIQLEIFLDLGMKRICN